MEDELHLPQNDVHIRAEIVEEIVVKNKINFEEDNVNEIIREIKNKELKIQLFLWKCTIHDGALFELSVLDHLRVLSLDGTQFSSQTLVESSVTAIDSNTTQISSQTLVESLATAIDSNTIQISQTLVESLATAIDSNTTIEILDLSNTNIGNIIGNEKVNFFINKNRTIREVAFCENSINCDVVPALAKALKTNCALLRLDLSQNKIGDVGAREIAKALEANSDLLYLDLSQNEIGDAGAREMAEALIRNYALRDLNLSQNKIGDAGAREMAEALIRNYALRDLNLSQNKIGDTGVLALAEALKANRALLCLDLSDTNTTNGAKNLAKIRELTLKNESIDREDKNIKSLSVLTGKTKGFPVLFHAFATN